MKINTLLLFFFLMLMFAAHPPATAQSDTHYDFDSILKGTIQNADATSVVICNNKQVLYNSAPSENTTQEIYPIHSASQWLTAATILTLVDDNLIDLDEPLGNYSKKFRGEKGRITMRQLLNHTSGLPPVATVADTTLDFQETVQQAIKQVKLGFPPGTAVKYGYLSYAAAVAVAEEVSGKQWQTLFYDKIARPCNLANTHFTQSNIYYPAVGAASSATDFSNFLIMLLNHGFFKNQMVLSYRSIDEMMKNTPIPAQDPGAAEGEILYGLGIRINKIDPTDGFTVEATSPEAHIFFPWINYCLNNGGVMAGSGKLTSIQSFTYRSAKAAIDSVFVDNCAVGLVKRADLENLVPQFPKDKSSSVYVTVIRFQLTGTSDVTLKIFDSLGNEVEQLLSGKMEAGEYNIPVEASAFNPGIYLYQLIVNGQPETKKLTIRN